MSTKADILSKIEERDQARKLKNEENKLDKNDQNLDQIYDQFLRKIDLITNLQEVKPVKEDFKNLQEQFNLSAGQQSRLLQKIENIEVVLNKAELDKSKNSRRKFEFRKKREMKNFLAKNEDPRKKQVVAVKNVSTSETAKNLKTDPENQIFTSKTQKIITLPGDYDFDPNLDILIKNVDAGKIVLTQDANTVHIENCQNLEIVCHCQTSIFMEKFLNSTLRVTCQQLRMHESTGLQVYCFWLIRDFF